MTPIPKTFFITGLGRSGTAFLAEMLGQSEGHRVVHEWKIPRTPLRDGRLQRFPLWRFLLARYPFPSVRRGYGEVNSHLRRTLSPAGDGAEALIERRGIILREPRDVVASGMNRSGRTEADFEALCEDVLGDFARLQALLRHPTLHYETFEFERFTRDPAYVLEIAEWAGITDLSAADVTVERKVNVNKTSWFPRSDQWTTEHHETFATVARRHGLHSFASV